MSVRAGVGWLSTKAQEFEVLLKRWVRSGTKDKKVFKSV